MNFRNLLIISVLNLSWISVINGSAALGTLVPLLPFVAITGHTGSMTSALAGVGLLKLKAAATLGAFLSLRKKKSGGGGWGWRPKQTQGWKPQQSQGWGEQQSQGWQTEQNQQEWQPQQQSQGWQSQQNQGWNGGKEGGNYGGGQTGGYAGGQGQGNNQVGNQGVGYSENQGTHYNGNQVGEFSKNQGDGYGINQGTHYYGNQVGGNQWSPSVGGNKGNQIVNQGGVGYNGNDGGDISGYSLTPDGGYVRNQGGNEANTVGVGGYSRVRRSIEENVKRGETESLEESKSVDNGSSLDEVLNIDQLGCGMRLICELSATPENNLLEEEKEILKLFGSNDQAPSPKEASRGKLTYAYAALLGSHARDAKVCGRVYDRCPYTGQQVMESMRQTNV